MPRSPEVVHLLSALEHGYRLAQSGVVSEQDFLLFQTIAADALRTVSSIARTYPLTEDEEEAVRTASRRVEGFTTALENLPARPAWWTWALAALGGAALGAGATALLSGSGSSRMSGPRQDRSIWPGALAVLLSGLVVGAAGFPYRESPGGAIALGAGSSAAGAALTLLLLDAAGSPVL